MYLYKDTYIGANYEHRNVQGVINLTSGIDNDEVHINFNRVVSIREQVAYWRKANQIHKWFVDNVQDGEDDCGNYHVGIEQLQELAETCRKVLNDKSLASELLPSQSGFFFGGTDYDDWYFKDLEYTATEIEKLLSIEKPEGRGYYPWSYVYHSSW